MKFNYKKKYGQNFISDKNLINKIVNLVPITKNDLVIEVGPGNGSLTVSLVKKAKFVLIYEIDNELKDILNNKLKEYNNYNLIINDFLNVDISSDIKKFEYDKIIFVSNLPYYITTPIIKKFIDSNIICDRMVVMLQEEVANRIIGKVGTKEYGSLSVFLNAFYNINKALKVNRNNFIPIPNVDSAVIVMNKKENIYIKDYDLFKKFVMDSFKYKRKILKNNLKGYNLEKVEKVLNKYNFSLFNRAEDISVDIFIEIVNSL